MDEKKDIDRSPRTGADSRGSALPEEPALLGNLLCGLAETLAKMGQNEAALRALAEAKSKMPNHFLPYLLQGTIHYERKQFAQARAELRQAKSLNPFHEEICNYLSLAAYHAGDLGEALDALIDAFLLSGEFKGNAPSTYQQRIKIIVDNMPDMTPLKRNQIFRERQALFDQLYQSALAAIGEAALPVPSAAAAPRPVPPPAKTSLTPQQREKFKAVPLFNSSVEDLLQVTHPLFQSRTVPAGTTLFKEEETPRGVYLCLSGRIVLQRSTPYGPLVYREVGEGGFAAEEHVVEGGPHWADGFCPGPAEVLLLPKNPLKELFLARRDVAVHYLWCFWKNIGRSLLDCRLRLIPELEREAAKIPPAKNGEAQAPDLQKEMSRRLQHLEHKNLTANEVRLLQMICPQSQHAPGAVISNPGEKAKAMYVVASGSVALSHGQEVHSLLEPGDFFGEIALISELVNAETARAYSDRTVLLPIDRQLCAEVLKGDKEQAYLFLSILTRMLGKRLLEMVEKIFQWKLVLAGRQVKMG